MREARPGDRYLICSDGLSDFVAGDTIEEVLTEGLGTAATAERLIEIALRAGTRDNVTVIVGDVVDLETGDAPSTTPEVVGAAADAPHRPDAGDAGQPRREGRGALPHGHRRGPTTTPTRSSSPRAARPRRGCAGCAVPA